MISEHEFVISGDDAWVTAYKDVLCPYCLYNNQTLLRYDTDAGEAAGAKV